ncbi:isocitrate lyase/PEP mutase family protein [Mycobacterium interjectum]|uniref:isocitrate lyase/PEP mutase family protein n=1 Tax=Mycobacterium interjectum TaxID=33895 RepID=UPI0008352F23|nr:isocitrate lyase/phosphoenolpyruvate mutase family protein [Mycobacterium interjectum]MCV7090119.1 isocitrate lyase/phosphoenolpyruvate mutase family protein [Mycobacterium interjectum]
MPSSAEKAARFAELHVAGDPVLLYNAWDAGSAKAIVEAGASAIASSSWSVAEAQGFRDGEQLPLDVAEQIIGRIAATVDVPVSADFEGGYSEDHAELADNAGRLFERGVIGINFEDRVVKGEGLYEVGRQADRIAAIRSAADQIGLNVFINARTDLFLGQGRDPQATVDEAIQRAKAYAAAGASGFFIPGLEEEALIGRICQAQSLPVNVMVMDGTPTPSRLAELGVARISWGPLSYLNAMAGLQREAREALCARSVNA